MPAEDQIIIEINFGAGFRPDTALQFCYSARNGPMVSIQSHGSIKRESALNQMNEIENDSSIEPFRQFIMCSVKYERII